LPILDVVVVCILALGAARGLAIGLVREAFSFAGVGGAVFAVWQFGDAAGALLAPHVAGSLPPAAVHALAVGGLGFGTLLAVTVVGRVVRRSIQFAGLGLVDRIAGGCLGAVEGALVAAVLVGAATLALAPGHPWLAGSEAATLFERVRTGFSPEGASPRDAAAPVRR